MSVMVQVQKNTISGRWEVRENGRKVVDTKYKALAVEDATTICKSLERDGIEVLTSFDLRGE